MAQPAAMNWTAQLSHRFNGKNMDALEAELKKKDLDLVKAFETNEDLLANLARIKKEDSGSTC